MYVFSKKGLSLTEVMIALVLGSLIIIAGYNYFKHTEKRLKVERIKARVQNAPQLAFFLIGRDIRGAGSNPAQAYPQMMSGKAAAPIPLTIAQPYKISIKSDLNADGDTAEPLKNL